MREQAFPLSARHETFPALNQALSPALLFPLALLWCRRWHRDFTGQCGQETCNIFGTGPLNKARRRRPERLRFSPAEATYLSFFLFLENARDRLWGNLNMSVRERESTDQGEEKKEREVRKNSANAANAMTFEFEG